MTKIRIAAIFAQIYTLSFLYGIIKRLPFLGYGVKNTLLKKIVTKGTALYTNLGPLYHIGIRSTRVPAKFKVRLYGPVDLGKMEKLHQEISELRKQRVAEQELSNTN